MNKVILILITLLINFTSVHPEYHCDMSFSKITCTNIQHNEASDGIKVTLANDDVGFLNISNSNITTISQDTFGRFPFLHTLYITKGGVKSVESAAFFNNSNLRELYLVDNFLTEFNSSVFVSENFVVTLDLSHNYLNDLSGFDVSDLPQLTLLNLTNNRLKYLPVNVIQKLQEKNSVYTVVSNNPFDCAHPTWSAFLTQDLIDIFCTNNTYKYFSNKFIDVEQVKSVNSDDDANDSDGERREISFLNDLVVEHLTDRGDGKKAGGTNTGTDKIIGCTFTCSFYYCVAWFAGGIWVGIIVGNVFKIKRLLFDKQLGNFDKNTQYDPADYSLRLLPKQ